MVSTEKSLGHRAFSDCGIHFVTRFQKRNTLSNAEGLCLPRFFGVRRARTAYSLYTHSKLAPILRYVNGQTILADLVRCGLVKLDGKGMPDNEKRLIRWRILGEKQEACWLDQSLFDAFTDYYLSSQTGADVLCMVTGNLGIAASQHPKGIVSLNGNAKLISANDSSGFTYRGRFTEESQALTVSYEASQKAHNALRWLVENQGVRAIFGTISMCGKTFCSPPAR